MKKRDMRTLQKQNTQTEMVKTKNIRVRSGQAVRIQRNKERVPEKHGNVASKDTVRKAMKCAFPYTLPIFAGFLFLGMAYGIYMNVSGFSFWYPMLMSLTIFAGSAEFVAANLLLGAFHPLQALVMTLMINARHLFYGISMLKRFRGTGWKKFYLIFGMCDESFSINYTADIPEDIDRGWFMFSVTLFNHLYWFCGATLGGCFRFSGPLQYGRTGICDDGYVRRNFYGAVAEREEPWQLTGGTGDFLCSACSSSEGRSFIIPSMLAILGVLTLLRKPSERGTDRKGEGGK